MPEAFIKDQTVPARWRVLGIINGFLINGHACWASNEWIADKLGCHKDTVSQAVKELEDRGEITVTRGARSRTITRKIGGSAYHEGGSTPISDRQQRLSNSVSNSVNIIPSEIVISQDEEERPKRVKKDTTYLKVFELWGKYPLSWRTHKAQIQAAKNLLEEHGLEEVKDAITFVARHKKDEFIPEIHTPWDLDTKWQKLEAFYEKRI